MPFILGLLIVGVVLYLLTQSPAIKGKTVEPPAGGKSDRSFAFLTNGLIFQRSHSGSPEQVHSRYIQEVLEKQERMRERHSWKEGTSFNVAASGGRHSFKAADKPILATSVTNAANGDLLYFLSDDNVGGLFRLTAATGNEQRVLLRPRLHLSDLNAAPANDSIAASSRQKDGVAANIVMFKDDGNQFRDVTGGDTVDSSPTWIPDAANKLLFQSAGIARNSEGYIMALGNSSIQMLDMNSGSVTPVMDDARFDYLKPRVCPAGNLHFIRRPYEPPQYNTRSALSDTLFFPFRLLRALFHYLNFFSLMYTNKPLTSANGPAMQADIKTILLQGKRIDAEQALRTGRPIQGVPSLVPTTWELVRRNASGVEQVLASSVATYDIAPDGNIFYSNGRGVFVLDTQGTAHHAYTGDLIVDVVARG